MGNPNLHNLDAEKTLLGAVMVDNTAMASAAANVRSHHFYSAANREIFEVMRSLFERSIGIDIITVKNELAGKNSLEACGGAAYLSALLDGLPRITNVEQWATIIRQKATVRSLKHAASRIDQMCSEPEDPAVLLDAALNEILEVSQDAKSRKGFKSPAEIAKATLTRLEQMSQKQLVGVPSGVKAFDELTGGARAPQLIVFAGRPGAGKSVAGATIASNAAAKGYRVAMFSQEMDADEIGVRLVAKLAQRSPEQLKWLTDAKLDETWADITKAIGELSKLPIFINDDPYLTVTQLLAEARLLKAQGGLDLIIVDYLQLLHGEGRRFGNRQDEIATIARALKNVAKDLQVPVIALSQLSREVEKREDKKPILSDLRESGEIEQAADIVVLLHREGMYNPKADQKKAEWIVAKHRNGRTMPIEVKYEGKWTAFFDAEIAMAEQAA